MPASGLLALLDDVASLLDDVAAMTKVASQKTAAVVGDDLALNANQLTGIAGAREIPVVMAVAKGSLVNKAILIPAALLITAFVPKFIVPLLMVGGTFLCFEGAEKILYRLFHPQQEPHKTKLFETTDPVQLERERIKGAIFTDFILSAEIMVIALGAAAGASFPVQALTLLTIGLGMTVLVYGLVALVVKADDLGGYLKSARGTGLVSYCKRSMGSLLLVGAPKFMKLLSILGTAAMFLVGGEIVAHGIHFVDALILQSAAYAGTAVTAWSGALAGLVRLVAVLVFGFLVGLVCVGIVETVRRVRPSRGS